MLTCRWIGSRLAAADHSVLRAVAAHRKDPKRKLVFAELGARWGTWGGRAIAFGRMLEPAMRYDLLFVEAHPDNCDALRETMTKNQIAHTLECAHASGGGKLRSWLESVSHVDAIDMDIQGAEEGLIPALLPLIDSKVHRLIIGTHNPGIHDMVRS